MDRTRSDSVQFIIIRIIFDENGYTKEERLHFKPVIYSNTIQSLLVILHAMKQLKISFYDERRQVETKRN